MTIFAPFYMKILLVALLMLVLWGLVKVYKWSVSDVEKRLRETGDLDPEADSKDEDV